MEHDKQEIDVLNESTLVGSLLGGRYRIDKFLDKGSNGTVHCVVD